MSSPGNYKIENALVTTSPYQEVQSFYSSVFVWTPLGTVYDSKHNLPVHIVS